MAFHTIFVCFQKLDIGIKLNSSSKSAVHN